MEFTKPFLTYDEQADLLISRGMVADRDALVEHLQDVGYYRLSGYWRIFRNDDDTLREGTTFERVWDLYVFDRQFRLVVLDAIERVEIYFRTQLSHISEGWQSCPFWEPWASKSCAIQLKLQPTTG